MPQGTLPQGAVVVDEGLQAKPKAVASPVAPYKAPVPYKGESGAGLATTGLSEVGSPFSMKDADGKWKLPDVIKGPLNMLKENYDPSMTAQQAVELPGKRISAAYHMFADPISKMTSGDSQAKAEGFGQMISNAMQMLLLDAAFKVKGGMPEKGAAARTAAEEELSRRGSVEAKPIQTMINPRQITSGSPSSPAGPPTPPPIDAQFTTIRGPSGPATPMSAPVSGLLDQPAAQAQLTAPKGLQITAGDMAAHKSLPPAPGGVIPAGSDIAPVPPDPRLPAAYANTQVGSTSGPGIMGRINLGEEGGIPARGEQTVTGVKPGPVRGATGFEKGTESSLLTDKGTAGRTSAEVAKSVAKAGDPPYVISRGPGGKFQRVDFPNEGAAPNEPTPPPKPKPKGKK